MYNEVRESLNLEAAKRPGGISYARGDHGSARPEELGE